MKGIATRFLWLGCFVASAACALPAGDAQQGRRLFEGQTDLAGRIRGHADPLPPASLRCANCHARATVSAPAASRPQFTGTQAFGPALTSGWLIESRSRRGGPPSAYTAGRLCTALREGLDPNQVFMARNMPIYQLTDRDCEHLWAFLTMPGAASR